MNFTLLLDLDDTLLDTNIEAFIPAYFQALAAEFPSRIPREVLIRALISGMRQMNESEDFSRTLEQVFNEEFFAKIDVPQTDLKSVIDDFYKTIFPSLSTLTKSIPVAKPFIEWAVSQGFRLALATDPLFPRTATHQRLQWAGLEPDQFQLISSYEHFHFTKTHPAYFAEMLGRLGWPEGPVLMVGNDLHRDILPAQSLGLKVFHIGSGDDPSQSNSIPTGDLADLRSWLGGADFGKLNPEFKTRDAIMGILIATPAVFSGFADGVQSGDWAAKPSAAEWSLTELVCHLRDTEREIHHIQLSLFNEQKEPFIPRPDTSVWASQRDYIHEDGPKALQEFIAARRRTIQVIREIPSEQWNRKARHAIFGPTSFLETTGFMADHDRLHTQQAWSILRESAIQPAPPNQ